MSRECYCGRPLKDNEKPCCKRFRCKYCKRVSVGSNANVKMECCAFCWNKQNMHNANKSYKQYLEGVIDPRD